MMDNKVMTIGVESKRNAKERAACDFIYQNDRVLAFVADVFSMYSTSQDELTEDAAFGMYLLVQNWRKTGQAINE